MGAAPEVKYSGTIDPEHDNGGSCDLELIGDRFELRIVLHSPYSIEDGTTFRGMYTESEDALVLRARELYSYHSETVRQEHSASSAREFVAAFAGPGTEHANVLDILIDARRGVLLLREDTDAANAQRSDLTAWLDAECARRRTASETQRLGRLHDRAIAVAAEAFQSKDYARVIMILEPREPQLSPADRKKLAYARRRLKQGAPG